MIEQAWSEKMIARALAIQFFERKHVVLVPNCNWTGHECDLLVVARDLRIIDVEIKISRADLKADAKKEKWWKHLSWAEKDALGLDAGGEDWWSAKTAQQWPAKVWKHYYAIPAEIWKPKLVDALPSTSSGILLLKRMQPPNAPLVVTCFRRATPNKAAEKISPQSAIDIARLANLRMWEAYAQVEKGRVAA